jgi:hypothetical protein
MIIEHSEPKIQIVMIPNGSLSTEVWSGSGNERLSSVSNFSPKANKRVLLASTTKESSSIGMGTF